MSNIKLFESKQIRSIWSEDDQKWYFSIIDVVAALTDSQNPRDYWYRIKQREKISGMELSTICRQFKLEAPDGKRRIDMMHRIYRAKCNQNALPLFIMSILLTLSKKSTGCNLWNTKN